MTYFWTRACITLLRRARNSLYTYSKISRGTITSAIFTTIPLVTLAKFSFCERNSSDGFKNSTESYQCSLNQEMVHPYVFIGFNATSISACAELLETDPDAKILILAQDFDDSYELLSKKFPSNGTNTCSEVKNCMDQKSKLLSNYEIKILPSLPEGMIQDPLNIFSQDKPCYSVVRSIKIKSIDCDNKAIKFCDGTKIKYEKLVLSMNSRTKKLSTPSDFAYKKFVIDFDSFNDQNVLEDRLKHGVKNIVVVGSSTKALELVSCLASNAKMFDCDLNITLVSPKRLLSRLITNDCSRILVDALKKYKINVVENSRIMSMESSTNPVDVKCDLVVGPIGSSSSDKKLMLHPELIINCDSTENDVKDMVFIGRNRPEMRKNYNKNYVFSVDPFMRVAPDIYAAGDCVNLYNPVINEDQSVTEFYEHSVFSGRLVASNVLGSYRVYQILPMTWCDLCNIAKIETIGMDEGDSPSLPSITVWSDSGDNEYADPQQKRGVMFYHRDGKIVKIATWNLNGKITLAEKVIRSELSVNDVRELAKLFFQENGSASESHN